MLFAFGSCALAISCNHARRSRTRPCASTNALEPWGDPSTAAGFGPQFVPAKDDRSADRLRAVRSAREGHADLLTLLAFGCCRRVLNAAVRRDELEAGHARLLVLLDVRDLTAQGEALRDDVDLARPDVDR